MMIGKNMLQRLKSSPGEEEDRSLESESFRTKIADLPEVLLVEILCRLPCNKLIFQCKLVSKPWYDLISAPYFVGRYLCLQRQMQKPILTTLVLFDIIKPVVSLIITSDHPVFRTAASNFTLNFLPCYNQAKEIEELAQQLPYLMDLVCTGSIVPPIVVGTYNDLVLCCATKNYQRHYYLCNPYTRQWVPLPPTPRVYHRGVLVAFVCDPYYKYSDDDHNGDEEQGTSTRTNSFIFNAEYKWKVVRLVPNSSDPNFHFEIFFSESRQWREIDVVCPRPFYSFAIFDDYSRITATDYVAYNGMLYWWSSNGLILELDMPKFNTSIAKYRFIEPPEGFNSPASGSLGVSGGRLRLSREEDFFPQDDDEFLQPFRVKELKQVVKGSEGKLKWLADSVPLACKNIDVSAPYSFKMLAFHPNNEDVVYLTHYHKIITCNLRGGTLEKTSECPVKGMTRVHCYPFSLPWWPTPVPRTLSVE